MTEVVTTPLPRDNRPLVTSLRHHILGNRRWAAWLIALVLLMKLIVPAGFMPTASAGAVTVELCSGSGPQTIVMAIPGLDHRQQQGDHNKADSPCAFAGLGAASLAAADPILIAIAIAFIIATVFRLAPVRVAALSAHLRPPLRGPPATV